MAKCVWTGECVFFTARVGYSPELWHEMKTTYCLTDNTGCARLRVMDFIPAEKIPDDLIPTDNARADGIIADASKPGAETAK